MVLADTHCHLNFEDFDADRDEVVARAAEAGIGWLVNPGIDLESSRAAVELAERYPFVYAAVGVHPNSSRSWESGTLEALRALAQHPKVVAIGEIGLDYYRDRAPRYMQEQVFHYQLELAAELNLPVIIHNREASQDVLRKLSSWQEGLQAAGSPLAERPGVLHSYSGNIEQARQAIAHNFCLGFTGPVTFKKAEDLRQIVRQLPLEQVLTETDAPFLTPHPYRGKRNEPAYVQFVAEKLAEIHDTPLDALAETTTTNAARLFNWDV